jgi:hypothetical protein
MKRLLAMRLAVLAVTAAGVASAQDEPDEADDGTAAAIADDYLDRTPIDCITLPRVRDTTIIDDGTVLFYMRDGAVYLNVLDSACFGLESSGRFSTDTRSTRLCSVDMLRVFRQFAGSVVPGAFCRLGEFHPLTRAEAEMLEMDLDELGAARRSVKLTPIDPIADSEETGP